MPKIITLEHLRKVDGFSFEDVVAVLVNKKIEHAIGQKPQVTDRRYTCVLYFRDSRIAIFQGDTSQFYSAGLDPTTFRGNCFWLNARYEMQPDFDRRQLHGAIVFKNGLLVERVAVSLERTMESLRRYHS